MITVIVELPFVLKTAELKFSARMLGITATLQTATYGVMMLGTGLLGSVSALTSLRAVDSLPTVAGWVYFIGTDRKAVYRIRLDGSNTERVATLKTKPRVFSRIVADPVPNSNRVRLVVMEGQDVEELQKNIGQTQQAAPTQHDEKSRPIVHFNTSRSFDSSIRVFAGYWAVEGLRGGDRRYALETPVLALSWRSPVTLPDGKLVAQFGQAILLIDPKTGTTRKLAEGSAPDVLLDLRSLPGPR